MRPSLQVFRLRLATTAIALIAATAGSAAQTAPKVPVDDIVGRWELTGRWQSEAVSTIIELLSGGWYSQALVATIHLRYEYNGADLVLMALDKKGAPDPQSRAVLSVRFDADTLRLTSPRDTIRMLRARGGEFEGDIKGRWLMLGGDDKRAVAQEFAADGSLRVITTLSGEVGRFRLVDKEIEWSPMLPTRPPRRTNYKVQGDKLMLWSGQLRDELTRLR